MMEAWLSKVITLVLAFLVTMLAGLLPLRLISIIRPENNSEVARRNSRKAENILSYLNCFSGGVFLAVTMLHMLPDVRSDFAFVLKEFRQITDFPLAEFVTFFGFFIVMFIENIVINCHKKSVTSAVAIARNSSNPSTYCSQTNHTYFGNQTDLISNFQNRSNNLSDLTSQRDIQRCSFYGSIDTNIHSDGHIIHNHSNEFSRSLPERVIAENEFTSHPIPTGRAASIEEQIESSEDEELYRVRDTASSRRLLEKQDGGSSHRRHETSRNFNSSDHVFIEPSMENSVFQSHANSGLHEDNEVHSLRSFVLLIALSTHTIFEGMALGLQENSEQVWTLFGAVILHKIIIAFTAGLRFADGLRDSCRTAGYMLVFALMTPIGVAVGLAVTEAGRSGLATSLTSSLLQGIATGTFLYVTFFEVLQEEMGGHDEGIEIEDDRSDSGRGNMGKVLSVIVGFACITAMTIVGLHYHLDS